MWTKILDTLPKEGKMLEVDADGRALFVTMNNGALYCAENRCPHEGVKLTLGCLKGNRIKCSLHGYSYDLRTGKSSEEGEENLKTYTVKQEDGEIYIETFA
ncbi:Ferredoxin [uncultured Candidatus Thioglobus sp.]|nr:Ferredoxin [uncultured Candidatus Thioglobus sp.]